MRSARLTYAPVSPATLDALHTLVRDEYVRRYLMDGNLFPREWTEERIRESIALFERRGVGLWLAHFLPGQELVGFCGFLEFPSIHPEPQLVYAIFERFTRQGYGTEMARAAMAEARRHLGFATIVAAVDEVNVASVRLLEKVGFIRTGTQSGHFGNVLVMAAESAEESL